MAGFAVISTEELEAQIAANTQSAAANADSISDGSSTITLQAAGATQADPANTINIGAGLTVTRDPLTGIYTIVSSGGGTGDVVASGALVDNSIIRGDGGNNIKQSGQDANNFWSISDDFLLVGSTGQQGFAMEIRNKLATGGGNGLCVLAGEQPEDLMLKLADQDDSFAHFEIEASGHIVWGSKYSTLLTALAGDDSLIHGFDNQYAGGDRLADFNTANGFYRIAGEILGLKHLDDVDLDTTALVVGDLLQWDGTNMVPSRVGRSAKWYNTDVSLNINQNNAFVSIFGDEQHNQDQDAYTVLSATQLRIDIAGTYNFKTHLHVDAFNGRVATQIRYQIGGTNIGAIGATGYIRNADGHQETSLHLDEDFEVTAGQIIRIRCEQSAAFGSVEMDIAGTSYFQSRRIR